MTRPALFLLLLLGADSSPARTVDYTIAARLNDVAGIVHGSETIRYRNLSPDTLGSLWLHLYPNAFRGRGSTYGRGLEAMGRFDFSLAREESRGWTTVDWTESSGRVSLVTEAGTELGLFLNPPLAPGDSVTFSLGFRTKVPSRFGELARNGRSFVLAHWYPQVAARTDESGWLLDGYHVFGHSPSAFGDLHVRLDVADDMELAAAGIVAHSEPALDEPGRRTFTIDAGNISDLAIAVIPGLRKMTRSIGGTSITVVTRSFTRAEWSEALMTTADMLRRMQEWNGPFPLADLTIVDGTGVVERDASYPGLIVMATRPIPYTRVFELALAQQVALQWTAGATGADELKAPGITQGMAAYSQMRYMDDKFGRTSLVSNPLLNWLLTGLNTEYYNSLYYYLGASNEVLCGNPTECRDQVGYQAATVSRPALLLLAEERRLGRPTFDSLMRSWMESRAGTHPDRFAFAAASPVGQAEPSRIGESDAILPTRLGDHRVQVRPIFALPSFRDYQLFYGPYVWADVYHGFQLCAWAQGRQFYDAGPLRGRHQWTASEIHSTRIKDWHSSISYQTPLTFINDRLRVYSAFDYSRVDDGAKLYFSQELGPVFRQPKTTVDFGYRYLNVKDATFRDERAWQLARTADIRLRVAHTYESRLFLGSAQVYVRNGMSALGSDSDYVRLGLEQSHTWRGLRPLNLTLRLFAGYVWGSVPRQDRFYLSGGLTSNAAEPVSWGYKGVTSGQENWHYDADVNCRGWTGEYRHGRAAYGLNLEASVVRLGLVSLHPFFDLGNVSEDGTTTSRFWQPRMDAGVRLKLGPLYADFPCWRHDVGIGRHELAFRWMLGLKIGGNLGSS